MQYGNQFMSKEVLLQTNNTNINARTIKPIMEEQELNKFSHIPDARKWPPKGTAKDNQNSQILQFRRIPYEDKTSVRKRKAISL